MQSIISKGKTVEEAIYLGLDQLDAKKSEVDIEIIQQEKQGFIGVGKRQAIVKMTLTNAQESTQPSSTTSRSTIDAIETYLDDMPASNPKNETKIEAVVTENDEEISDKLAGMAWVTEGKLVVKDSPTQLPTVTIGEGIQLIKNNQPVKQKSTVISEKDHLEVYFEPTSEAVTKWKVTLDSSKLNAVLSIEPGYRITRTLEEVEPSDHIELTLIENMENLNTLQYKDVLAKLEELRVVYGFNHSSIVEAANATEPGDYTIATGKNPEPGKNGWIELKVEINPMNGLVEDQSGNVNFRDSKHIPTVEKGSIIGIIHPPLPGTPGVTVTNEPLLAKQTHPLKVVAGKGMEVVDDKLVATESGRPSVEQRGQLAKVKIVPKLIHQDNVSIATGNIRFHGDVEILGEVEENMLVEAEGDIIVHKSASIATLTTLKSIVVKGNVVNSDLAAGKNNMLIVELGHLLGIMNSQLEQMISVIKQLMNSPAFKSTDFSISGLQPLIMILLEKRFKNFLPYAKNYQEVVEKGQDYLEDKEWVQVGLSIKQIFLSLSNQVTTLDRLNNLQKTMKELADLSQLPVEPNAYITISDTINSKLYCSGDISIIGKGCISSKVHAGGKLQVKGVVRGGEVYGRLGVTINEVGAISGVKTIVAVPKDQTIQIKKAFEGTILKIGNITTILKDDRKHILARLDDNDAIIFQ
ncbi:FapA family protein [Ornithinibacillus contaminans]|uniref:FapA family protein n=1 Tax=Ornithinibacillus contaminans TaxID=694055 RepID=UPI00064DFB79|nr:FapA family protein [Ornithinibacillus contaminans]